MQFEEYKNLWVFVETEENAAKSVGYELLSPAVLWPIKWAESLWL